MWKFKEEIAEESKPEIKAALKENLEGLVGKVPGLLKAQVLTELMPSNTHDMALITELDSVESLKGYAMNPAHVAAADTYVRPFVCERSCLDYEV